MATHVYALLDRRDADACLSGARQAVAQWESGWCEASGLEVLCHEVSVSEIPADAKWRMHRQTDGTVLWSYISPGFVRQVERLVFTLGSASRNTDGQRESDVATAVAEEATTDLASTLLAQFSGAAAFADVTEEAPPAWQHRRCAGAALVQLSSSGKSLGVLLPHGMLPRRERTERPATRPSPEPLQDTLRGVASTLTAELDGAEISLGQLTSLAVGDVVTLDHLLGQPLKVYAANRRLVALGHLGKQDEHRAVELFSAI